MFSEQDRGNAVAIYALGPLLGPGVGPIIAGYVTQTIGWKWIFVIIGGMSALASAAGIPILRETYAPIIQLQIAKAEGADAEKVKEIEEKMFEGTGGGWALIRVNMIRPFILFFKSSICFLLSLYMGL